jgi:hypothetical protein
MAALLTSETGMRDILLESRSSGSATFQFELACLLGPPS